VTTDALIAGVHFPADTPPWRVGHKAAAVNLSDLAAMGALPVALTLNIFLGERGEHWANEVAQGASALCREHNATLTHFVYPSLQTRLSVQALGDIHNASPITRRGVRAGDDLYVTGTLGDAGGGLSLAMDGEFDPDNRDHKILSDRLDCPTPRLLAGRRLVGLAIAALDISDGLSGDVRHLFNESAKGITLYAQALPLSPALMRTFGATRATEFALSAGDDYELAFAASAQARQAVGEAFSHLDVKATRVGHFQPEAGVRIAQANGQVSAPDAYQHF
jgi:thiamine-monophosphate kinase